MDGVYQVPTRLLDNLEGFSVVWIRLVRRFLVEVEVLWDPSRWFSLTNRVFRIYLFDPGIFSFPFEGPAP